MKAEKGGFGLTIEHMLKEVILSNYKSIRAFTLDIDVPYSTIDTMFKRGIKGTSIYTVAKVCKALNIDPLQLMENKIHFIEKVYDTSLSEQENEHIKKYRQLDLHGKTVTDHIIHLEYERVQSQKKNNMELIQSEKSSMEQFKNSPTVQQHKTAKAIFYDGIPASAGDGYYSMDIAEATAVELQNPPPKGTSFIIRVSGDSMEPLIQDGDNIFIKSQKDVEIGEIGIFIVNNEFFVKKRGKNTLISCNPKYPPIQIGEFDTVYCKGKFLGVCKENILST